MIDGNEVAMGSDGLEPYDWQVGLPPGAYSIAAKAIDFAGNEAISEAVLVGVDQDPPLPPDDGDDSETGSGSDDDSDDGSEVGTGTGEGEDTANADGGEAGDSKGCACTSSGTAPGGGFLALGLLGLLRRRRQA